MVTADRDRNHDRIAAAAAVAALHALLLYALMTGLALEIVRDAGDSLKIFNAAVPAPPPPVDLHPARVPTRAPEGAASPANLAARPTPVVAPPPRRRIDVPPPLPAAPAAGEGSASSAGASTVPGPGAGSGTGSGRAGSGTGGGGLAAQAQRESGRLSNEDYPRASLRAGIEGTVIVRFTVGTDGRVGGCRVTRSSANAELDATTCRLVEQRFRYRPARDAEGRPVPELVSRTFDWMLPFRR